MARIAIVTLVWVLAGAACGDDHADLTPDAGLDSGGPDSGDDDHATAFAVAGDFAGVGLASTIGIPSLEVDVNAVTGVASSDPYVRYFDGTIYVINSFGALANHDNIVLVNAADLTFIDQITTGDGSLPQDVAVKGSTVYVAGLNAPGVIVLDVDEPAAPIQTIDLSALDPGDGIPDCNSLYLVGDRLFVTCGLLQDFAPVGPGKVVVIDTSDNSVIDSFDLVHGNPFGFIRPTPADSALGGDLLISTVAFPDLTSGCLERIGTGPTPGSNGCLVDNAALGGFANSYAYGADDTVYIAVTEGYDPGPISTVRRYDAAAGALAPEPMTPPEQSIFDLVRCPTGELVMADAAAGGLRVYSAAGDELTDQVLDIGLPPVSKGLTCY